MPIALSDASMSALLQAAAPLPVQDRDQFLQNVADRIAALPVQRRGDGSIALIAREEQHRLLVPPDDWTAGWSRKVGRPRKADRTDDARDSKGRFLHLAKAVNGHG